MIRGCESNLNVGISSTDTIDKVLYIISILLMQLESIDCWGSEVYGWF